MHFTAEDSELAAAVAQVRGGEPLNARQAVALAEKYGSTWRDLLGNALMQEDSGLSGWPR